MTQVIKEVNPYKKPVVRNKKMIGFDEFEKAAGKMAKELVQSRDSVENLGELAGNQLIAQIREEEGITEIIPVVCHNCNKVIKMVDRESGEAEERIDQCDKCSALPTDPRPPAHHLDFVNRMDREQVLQLCRWCGKDVEDECYCVFCPSCRAWISPEPQAACYAHDNNAVPTIDRKGALELGIICVSCGQETRACVCDRDEVEEIDEEILDEAILND